MLRRQERITEARDVLVAVEAEAVERGLLPLVAKARQSLRRAGVRATVIRGATDGPLSARERDVLLLVGKGMTARGIAQQLGVAVSTVETQITSAMNKLGVTSRLQAAVLVQERRR